VSIFDFFFPKRTATASVAKERLQIVFDPRIPDTRAISLRPQILRVRHAAQLRRNEVIEFVLARSHVFHPIATQHDVSDRCRDRQFVDGTSRTQRVEAHGPYGAWGEGVDRERSDRRRL